MKDEMVNAIMAEVLKKVGAPAETAPKCCAPKCNLTEFVFPSINVIVVFV